MHRFKQGWIGVIGDIIVAVEVLRAFSEWRVAKAVFAVFNIGGAIDFITEHAKNPGWMGSVLTFLSYPATQLAIIAIGLSLIFWDSRRTREITPVSGDRFSATVEVYGIPRRTWILRVEPHHLIIVGLAIAVIGSLWLMLRGQDPRIEQLQNQVSALQQQSSKAANAPSTMTPSITSLSREHTKRTIRELRALYEGRTRLQADAFMADEKGKSIEAEGTIVNIDPGMAMLQTSQEAHNGMPDFVECRFSPEWNAKLGTYRQGEKMKIRGVIGQNQNGSQIYLQDCEIVS